MAIFNDPVREFHDKRTAFTKNVPSQDVAEKMALDELYKADKDFVMNNPEEVVLGRMRTRAKEIIATATEKTPPPGTIFPREGEGVFDTTPARRVLNTALSVAPPGSEPNSTVDLFRLRAPLDLLTGNVPNASEAFDTVSTYAPGAAAWRVAASARYAKNLKSLAAALGVSGGVGAFEPVARGAGALQRGGMPLGDSLGTSFDATTLGDMGVSGLTNAAFEGLTAVPTIAPVGLKEYALRGLGVASDVAQRWMRDAAEFNIGVGLKDVTTSDWLYRIGSSVGRFPALQKHFERQAVKQNTQVTDAFSNTLGDVAETLYRIHDEGDPEKARRFTEISLSTLNRAEAAWSLASNEHDRLYKSYLDDAIKTGATIRPVSGEVAAAREAKKLRQSIRKEVEKPVLGANGKPLVGVDGKPVTKKAYEDRKPTGDVAKALTALNDVLDSPEKLPTVEQFNGTVRRLRATLDQVGGPDTTVGASLVSVISALREDLEHNMVGGGPETLVKKKLADTYYRESVQLFGGKTSNLLRQIDKEFGRLKQNDLVSYAAQELGERQGAVDPLEITSLIFDKGGPSGIEQFYRMLTKHHGAEGQKVFREAYGIHLARQLDAATEAVKESDQFILNATKLRERMGLGRPLSSEYVATSTAMKRAGIDPVRFSRMLDLTERLFRYGIPASSQLMNRRVMLGGLQSGANTFAPVKPFFFGPETASATLRMADKIASNAAVYYFVLKKNAQRILDPSILANYTKLIDPKAPVRVRARAAQRLLVLDAGFGAAVQAAGLDDEITLSPEEMQAISSGGVR